MTEEAPKLITQVAKALYLAWYDEEDEYFWDSLSDRMKDHYRVKAESFIAILEERVALARALDPEAYATLDRLKEIEKVLFPNPVKLAENRANSESQSWAGYEAPNNPFLEPETREKWS